MHNPARITTAALVGLGLAFGSAPVLAQGAQSQGAQNGMQGAQQAPKSSDISNSQVKKFAHAQSKVQNIRKEWQGKISDAKNQKKAMKYQKEANQKMIKAVKDSDLSVQQYNKIARAARTDPKLAKRIQSAQ
jgi:Skp family chaperone for outer membrane proteins